MKPPKVPLGQIYTEGRYYRFQLVRDGEVHTWMAKTFDEARRLRAKWVKLGWEDPSR